MWTPIALQLLTLIVLLAGGWFALQVAIYTRGGELSRSWHLLVGATLIFALQLVLELMAQLQVLEVQPWILLASKLVVAVGLALGFFHQMRSLS
ncbi:MAG TPA: hypothetical protein VGB99_11685 [Acidobacteriota bacterium]